MNVALHLVVTALMRLGAALAVVAVAVIFTVAFAATVEFLANASVWTYLALAVVVLFAGADKHWHVHRHVRWPHHHGHA